LSVTKRLLQTKWKLESVCNRLNIFGNNDFFTKHLPVMKKMVSTILMTSVFILSSCTQTINYDLEEEYFKEEKEILYYKGTPFTGVLVRENEYFVQYQGSVVAQYGQLKKTYKDGKVDGPYEDYYENGQIRFKTTLKNGKEDGPYEEYYENGQLKIKTTYKNGELDGPTKEYYENGQLKIQFGRGVFQGRKGNSIL